MSDDQQVEPVEPEPNPQAAEVTFHPQKKRRRAPWVLLIVLVVAGGGAAAWFLLGDDEPDYPDEWDPRVASLVSFVERERDLDFEHPVHVDFLTPDEYREISTTEESDLSEEDKADLRHTVGAMRALGLVEGELDLLKSLNKLSDEGTLASYSPSDKRIRIRGTKVTPGLRVTLVHELTHVLQDQHFDLERLEDEAEDDDDSGNLRAIIEGDADRIEEVYRDRLNSKQKAAVGREEDQAEPDLEDIPPVVLAFFAAPYVLGDPAVQLVVTAEGEDRLNEVIRKPPPSDEQIFDPYLLLEGDEPDDVDVPKLADGEKHLDDGDFGVLSWYLVLVQRLDAKRALAAVDGWGGDAYVQYEHKDRTCMRIAYQGEDLGEVNEFRAALDDWATAMPKGTAKIKTVPRGLELTSCDPGADVRGRKAGDPATLLALPLIRTGVMIGLIDSGAPDKLAHCVANRLIGRFTPAQLTGDAKVPQEEISSEVAAAAAACR